MLNLAITLICALFFLLSGSIIEFIKRIFHIIITIILKLLNLLGIKLNNIEGRILTSKEFKATFPDIKMVNKSTKNIRTKPSINLIALLLFIISLALIIINLDVISNNVVSKWLYNLHIEDTRVVNVFLISSQKDMDIVFTAVMFSMVSFSTSKLINQWKETVKFRQAKKEMKLKQAAINLMTSKELLDAAKNKDNENYKLLKKED